MTTWSNAATNATTYGNELKSTVAYSINTEDNFALLTETAGQLLTEYDSPDWNGATRATTTWTNATVN